MLSGWWYLLIEWILPILMVPIVIRGRSPTHALAWLGIIFAFPPLGILAYLMFGVFGIRRRGEVEKKVRAAISDELQRANAEDCFADSENEEYGLAHLLVDAHRQPNARQPLYRGNRVELHEDEAAYDALCDDIGAAQEHVHMLYFIFAPDRTGRRVADALKKAAARGVHCRLLVDHFGSKKFLRELAPELREAGVEVHAVLKVRPIRRPMRRFDVRNHRKVAVIDGRIGHTGSSNIHDEDFDLKDRCCWHQISARVQGPIVHSLQALFLEDWWYAADEQLEGDDLFQAQLQDDGVAAQIVVDGPTFPAGTIRLLYVHALHSARERVTIATPYFVPDPPLLLALRAAALRGVKVRLIVPKESDRRIADIASRSFWEPMLQDGVEIYEHHDGVLHAKAMSVDGRFALLGTANLDERSLSLNYEMMLHIPDAKIACELEGMLEGYLPGAELVEAERFRNRSRMECFKEDLAKLLSPLL